MYGRPDDQKLITGHLDSYLSSFVNMPCDQSQDSKSRENNIFNLQKIWLQYLPGRRRILSVICLMTRSLDEYIGTKDDILICKYDTTCT